MARTILVAGTASHVGKSTVAAGLCRLLARRGVAVAPYKAQNMSNNARVALTPEGEWGEIGVSQYVQARAAEIAPTTAVNPVLLKPRGDGESQLVVEGQAVGHFAAGDYYDEHWEMARKAAEDSFRRLASDHEVIIAEGAGSIAEINLHERDLANVETARFAEADILLVADIEHGGVFASVYGTLELLPEDLREQVEGVVINKFRGDPSLLEPGLTELEDLTGVPFLGILPHDDPGLPEEDSVSLPPEGERTVFGADDGISDDHVITVAVPRLPRISNFTDLEPLVAEPGVRVAYVPLDTDLDDADAVVIPGTKNTVDDLLALREAGFGRELRAFDGPVVGLCGGYQMLGERITNAGIESTADVEVVEGFGLLPVETRFSEEKRVERVEVEVEGEGPLAGSSGLVKGYEIHMGRSRVTGDGARPFGGGGAATEGVLGTYLHGLFENESAREAFVECVFDRVGQTRPDGPEVPVDPYDRAAGLLAEHLDLDALDLP